MRRLLAVVSVMAMVVGASIAPAAATTTRLPVAGSQQVIDVDDSDARLWTSAHIDHVRGRIVTAIQDDSTFGEGTVHGTVNVNLDTTSGTGMAWGSFRSDYGDAGFEGTFRGPVHLDPVLGPVGTWQVVARGWGEAAGMQVRGTVVEVLATGSATYSGWAFVPGDR